MSNPTCTTCRESDGPGQATCPNACTHLHPHTGCDYILVGSADCDRSGVWEWARMADCVKISHDEYRLPLRAKLPQGTPVTCNGYPGSIVRHYSGNTYEIRVPGGVVATDDFEEVTR